MSGTVPWYTVLTAVAIVAVLAYELLVARTGVLRRSSFWLSMAIVWSFQVFVDGWLTKLSSPIVRYAPETFSGIRIFFDSPIEDFGFGFAMITLTIITWEQLGRRERDAARGTT